MAETAGPVGIGLTGFASAAAVTEAAAPSPAEQESLEDIARLLSGQKIAILTGAGLSTDSGIPDYRGPDSLPRTPLTYQQFTGSDELRRRYWARNHLGWQHLRRADPNPGHAAVAAMERHGITSGIITQNVDRLHEAAGAVDVVDLHGRFDQVICLHCHTQFSRQHLAGILEELNPGFVGLAEEAGGAAAAPDADAELDRTLVQRFVVAPCEVCGGMLKPDFVFFGESVPKDRVARSYAMVDAADALLVAGSSLTVMSGLRFPRHMAKRGKSVVIINRGTTRGDDTATIKLEAGVSESLSYLADALSDGATLPVPG
ncbi:NAD-dependent protein deacetylase [Paenarthrobacter sp. Z7-10]|uniref:NAD-dependent protein deacetylase n=1 Tax=Paenarthrobacter sp. Z7-10 TaxID=2787635 RepID=UPI0022A9B5A1|nr:NAD-dependent protein deacetylase [Paenarthrobacter sp. Z7-10]MCZ2404838.1 NAD-dependent protein deacetylase [Paenarthrobacter sp. Z7-10]